MRLIERWRLLREAAQQIAAHSHVRDKLLSEADREKALEEAALYRQAAQAGDRDAEYEYGLRLRVAGDLDAAAQWFRRSAAQGHTKAMVNLGGLLERNFSNPDEALEWYEAAAHAGEPVGAWNAYVMYLRRRDKQRSGDYLRQAAEGGHPLAKLKYPGARR